MLATQTAQQTLITTYLEMTRREQAETPIRPSGDVRIERMQIADVDFYLYLYQRVGEAWCWRDRLLMDEARLQAILDNPQTHIYVLYVAGAPAGYIELYQDVDSVEVAYFGLREAYHGRGLGKYLLSYGLQQAWALQPQRVWLHTCNLDSPYALSNYQKRGFTIYKQEHEPMPQRYM